MRPEDMREIFCKKNYLDGEKCEAWAFGGNPDKLAELVLRGVKTATSSLRVLYELEHEPLPKQGDYSVILDSRGDARCVIKTTRVCVVPFDKVSEAHAYKEGEGDRTLAFWRETHRDFFAGCLREAGLSFFGTMDVVCEEFEIAYAD